MNWIASADDVKQQHLKVTSESPFKEVVPVGVRFSAVVHSYSQLALFYSCRVDYSTGCLLKPFTYTFYF